LLGDATVQLTVPDAEVPVTEVVPHNVPPRRFELIVTYAFTLSRPTESVAVNSTGMTAVFEATRTMFAVDNGVIASWMNESSDDPGMSSTSPDESVATV
jgi:hypothetical protein